MSGEISLEEFANNPFVIDELRNIFLNDELVDEMISCLERVFFGPEPLEQ